MLDIGPCELRFDELRHSSSTAIRNLSEVWTRSIRGDVPVDRKDLQEKLNAFHADLSKSGCADQVFEIYQYFSDARSFDTRIAAQAEDGAIRSMSNSSVSTWRYF
jgi:hypothetical protein